MARDRRCLALELLHFVPQQLPQLDSAQIVTLRSEATRRNPAALSGRAQARTNHRTGLESDMSSDLNSGTPIS
jgi:hypothetical protein